MNDKYTTLNKKNKKKELLQLENETIILNSKTKPNKMIIK